MLLSDAVRQAYRRSKATLEEPGVLYEVTQEVWGKGHPAKIANPGSVYTLGRRFRQYGLDYWKRKERHG